jgi:hypothetical protein
MREKTKNTKKQKNFFHSLRTPTVNHTVHLSILHFITSFVLIIVIGDVMVPSGRLRQNRSATRPKNDVTSMYDVMQHVFNRFNIIKC